MDRLQTLVERKIKSDIVLRTQTQVNRQMMDPSRGSTLQLRKQCVVQTRLAVMTQHPSRLRALAKVTPRLPKHMPYRSQPDHLHCCGSIPQSKHCLVIAKHICPYLQQVFEGKQDIATQDECKYRFRVSNHYRDEPKGWQQFIQ